jgi:peptide/nickel transport system ATP-binding protein
MHSHLLEVEELKTVFPTEAGILPAVDGVSFHLDAGETLGIVGESGCGKSMTAMSILRLVPAPGKIVGGEVRLEDKNLLQLPVEQLRSIRGRQIGMVFQDPLSSLNPVRAVGKQIGEVLEIHGLSPKAEMRDRVIDTMHKVGFPSPERNYDAYPHELSGGMRQRAMIAMALIGGPKILIADEPTTALDVTIQAQILELLQSIQEELGLAVMLITHNLGIVAEVAKRIVVMYAGNVVEAAPTGMLFAEAFHPYTRGLLASVPTIERPLAKLFSIPGTVPNPLNFPKGCRFHPRCDRAMEKCANEVPPTFRLHGDRSVACWLMEGETSID